MPLNKETKQTNHTSVGHYCQGGYFCRLSSSSLLAAVNFYTLLASIIFCKCYKDFHFIYDLSFGYFSFSNLLLDYNSFYD